MFRYLCHYLRVQSYGDLWDLLNPMLVETGFFLEGCSDFKCDVHRLMCFHTWSTARDTMEGSVTFRIWNLSLGEVCHSGTTMRFIPWLLSGCSLLLNCRCREIHCPHSPEVLSQPWWTVSSLNCKPKQTWVVWSGTLCHSKKKRN